MNDICPCTLFLYSYTTKPILYLSYILIYLDTEFNINYGSFNIIIHGSSWAIERQESLAYDFTRSKEHSLSTILLVNFWEIFSKDCLFPQAWTLTTGRFPSSPVCGDWWDSQNYFKFQNFDITFGHLPWWKWFLNT